MHFKKHSVLIWIVGLVILIEPVKLFGENCVVPNYAQSNQLSGVAESVFMNVMREQLVYNSSEFPNYPILINELRWRPDDIEVGPVAATVVNLQVSLSTTTNGADHLRSTFSENIGTNTIRVFKGDLNVQSAFVTLSNGTKAFDISLPLQAPFFFDPSRGNLLVDLQNFGGCNVNLYNNGVNSGTDAASRIYNSSDPNGEVATGADSGAGVIEIVYTLIPQIPFISAQPSNQTVAVGNVARFTVGAGGTPPLGYQWYFNDAGGLIAGATNNSLLISNVQPDQAGEYFVQVSNVSGTVVSSNAALSVTLAPVVLAQPASQTVQLGASATFSVTATSELPMAYQWFYNNTNILVAATNSSLVLTNFQVVMAGSYSVQISNAYGATMSSNADLLIGFVVPRYAASNQIVGVAEGIFTSILREQVVYNSSELPFYPIIIKDIRWRPDAITGGPVSTIISNLQINLSTTINNADHLNSIFAQNTGADDTMVFSGAMGVASLYATLPNGTKAFDIDLQLQTYFLFDPIKGNLLVDLRNFTGCGANLYNNGVNSVSDATSRIYNTSDSNGAIASGGDSGAGVIEIGYIAGSVPPIFGTQPVGQTVTVGGSVSFVAVAGPPPLKYQWFFGSTDTPLSDETNSLLTLSNVQLDESGSYFVRAVNDFGATVSSNVLLKITVDTPVITNQPLSRIGLVGTNFTFSVLAGGSLPLSYQWFFNTNNLILGATNSSLVLTNIHMSQAGTYSVAVSNPYGTTNSAFALLTVNFPPANIFLGNTNVMGGGSFDVPVFLAANGNENTLSFSLNFPTQQMAYAGITLGSGALDAGFLPNTSQTAGGRVGVTLQLPPGETFAPGTQEVVRVSFLSAVVTGAQVVAPVNFTNQPINRLLFDSQGVKLATNFINGSVTLTTTDFEGDVTPRPVGDRSLDIFDWSQVGRFVAGLDSISNATEFQRADCAPKTTGGDGQLKVTDWVQAGRYGAAIDSMSVVGGPSAPVTPTILTGGPRTLSISAGTAVKGLNLTTPIILQSQGNENAVGFSVNFNPTVLKYLGTIKGGAATSATLNINSNQVASGVLGVALALPAGNSFASGQQEVAKINFTALVSTTNTAVTLSDSPVLRSISDPVANELSANYSNLSLSVNPPPALSISSVDTNALLAWPVWATGFNLQGAGSPSSPWTNVSGGTQTNSSNISITVPMPYSTGYFRLLHP